MSWPTSQDYNEAIQNAATALSDPGLKSGEVVCNAIGLPVPRSGNFADVYQFKGGEGKMWAVKCFTRKVPGLEERYTKINDYLTKANLPFVVGFKYMEEGIRIRGQWYPLLKMEWVEGFTLNEFVRQNADKPSYLHALVQMWAKLAAKLRDSNIAHADLQHGNVLLVPGATPAKLGLKLIDYDGMWVPPLADNHSGEVGHPNFQHPLRLKERLFNADVDRFPHLVIACALRATMLGGKAVWEKFDNGDNLLFKEKDLANPADAAVFKSLWEKNDKVLNTLLGHIALSASQPLRKTPWLDDVLLDEKGPSLTADQEAAAMKLLGIAPRVETQATAEAAPAAQEQFNIFEVVDDDKEPSSVVRRPAIANKKKKKEKEAAKKSKLPLFIGGGVLVLALIGGIIAMMAGGGKKEKGSEQEVAKNDARQDENKPKGPIGKKEPGTDRKETNAPNDPKEIITPNNPKDGKIPKDIKVDRVKQYGGIEHKTAVIGVAVVPNTKDYLFIAENDPVIYGVLEATGKKAIELGRLGTPIRAIVSSADGTRVITGCDDGTMRISSPRLAPDMSNDRIIGYPKITTLAGDYGIEAYHSGVRLRNNVTEKDEFVKAGNPGHALSAKSQQALTKDESYPKRFGAALTDEVAVFEGALTVQVFQGGEIIAEKSSNKIFMSFHVLRKNNDPSTAANSLRELQPGLTLKEHAGPVLACAISPDNEHAVSVGEDGQLCEWDIKVGRLVRKFKVPTALAIAYFPDGKTVLIGTKSESASIWHLASEKKLKDLPGHVGNVRAVCISSDGKTAYTAGDDSIVRVWNVAGGELTASIKGHKGSVFTLAMTPDGRHVVSAGADENIHYSDVNVIGSRSGFGVNRPIRAISFFSDGRNIVFGMGMDAEGGAVLTMRSNVYKDSVVVKNDVPKVNDPKKDVPIVGGPALLKAPFTKEEAEKSRKDWAEFLKIPERKSLGLRNGVSLELMLIPPGEFRMAAQNSRPVTISKPFYMASTETTQEQFQAVMGNNPSAFSAMGSSKALVAGMDTAKFPVENVSWDDAVEFCAKIRAHLPTEAQWEYACRAGTTTSWHFGNSITPQQVNFARQLGRTTKAGSYPSNTFGLHDMHGNVFEWTRDVWDPKLNDLPEKDPERTTGIDSEKRVIRGGNWSGDGGEVLSGSRANNVKTTRSDYYGFRVTMPVPEGPDTVVAKKDPAIVSPSGEIAPVWKVDAAGPLLPLNLAITPDGSKVLYVPAKSADIEMVDGREGKSLGRFNFPQMSPESLNICPDGSLIVTRLGGVSGLWDLKENKQRYFFDTFSFPQVLAINRKDNTVFRPTAGQAGGGIYSLADGKKVGDFPVSSGSEFSNMVCTPDGKSFGCFVGKTQIYVRILAGKPIFFSDPSKTTRAFAMSPDGKYLLGWGHKPDLVMFDTADGKIARTFTGDGGTINDATFTPDGKHIVSVSADGKFCLWDVESGKVIREAKLAGTGIAVRLSEDGSLAVTATNNPSTVQLWRLSSGVPAEVVVTQPKQEADPGVPLKDNFLTLKSEVNLGIHSRGIRFSADGKRLCALLGDPKEVGVVDVGTGKTLATITGFQFVASALLGRDNEIYIWLQKDGRHYFETWDWATNKLLHSTEEIKLGGVGKIVPTVDPRILLLTDRSSNLIWWDVEKREVVDRQKTNAVGVTDALPIPGGDFILLNGSKEDGLKVWDSKKKQEPYLLENPPQQMRFLEAVVSPNGKWIVAIGLPPAVAKNRPPIEIHIWNAGNGKLLHHLTNRFDLFFGGFAAASNYCIVRENFLKALVIDLATGKIVVEASAQRQMYSFATYPPENLLAASEPDNMLRIYKMNFGAKASDPVVVKKPDPLGKKDPVVAKKEDPKPASDGPIASSENLPNRISACFYSSDGKKIYVTTDGGAIYVLDPLTLKEITKYNIVEGSILSAVAAPKSVAPNANLSKEWLYILDERKRFYVFDSEKEAVTKTVPMQKLLTDPNQPPSYKLTVTPDARILFALSTGGWTGIRWDLKTHAETTFAPLQRPPFNGATSTQTVIFSADGRIGAASTGSKILVWNARTGADVANFDCRFVSSLTIVPEANLVVASGFNLPLSAWNYVTGKEIWNDQPIPKAIQAIPRSKRLAYSTANELVIRDCANGADTQRWKMAGVSLLATSSDGKYLLSNSRLDTKLHLWAIPSAAAKKP